MTNILIASGSALGLISAALFNFGHDATGLLFTAVAVLAFTGAAVVHSNKKKSESHIGERKILLNSALEIIDARTRLTVELVSKFRDDVKKYRYVLTEEQQMDISHLLDAAGDVRINDTELSDDLPGEERTKLIAEKRLLLDKIEKSRVLIERYLSENT